MTHADSKGLERGAICKETDGGDGMGNGEREGERERGGECAVDGEMEHCGGRILVRAGTGRARGGGREEEGVRRRA